MAGLLRALVSGALLGALFGAVARLLMRLVALDTAEEPTFSWSASLGIALLFALSGAGAGAASRVAHHPWIAVPVVVLTSLPVFLLGGAIGTGELVTSWADLPVVRRMGLVVLAAAILVLTCATPYFGWRVGRRGAAQVAADAVVDHR